MNAVEKPKPLRINFKQDGLVVAVALLRTRPEIDVATDDTIGKVASQLTTVMCDCLNLNTIAPIKEAMFMSIWW